MTTCIGTNRRSRSFSFWQLTHLIWARIGQIEWCSENWDYFLQIVSLNPPLHWKPSGECTDCPSQGNQDTNADKNWKLVDTCFVSLALSSGSVDLGGTAKHTNVTHQYLQLHTKICLQKREANNDECLCEKWKNCTFQVDFNSLSLWPWLWES